MNVAISIYSSVYFVAMLPHLNQQVMENQGISVFWKSIQILLYYIVTVFLENIPTIEGLLYSQL